MMYTKPQTERLLRYVREHGLVRPRELAAIDIPRSVLKRLVDRGQLIRRARGIYSVPDYEPTENTDMVSVVSRAPKAVICLLSALRFHELTTQNPFQVWIMIDRAGHRPVIDYPPICVVHASGKALTEGIGTHAAEGIDLKITNPAKTVADCFRYRRLVGMDVAIEALRDCWRQRKATMDELYGYARIDRVASFMRPYMESLV